MMRRMAWTLVGALLVAGTAGAVEVPGTCAVSSIRQDFIAPATLSFPFILDGTESIPVTIDTETGAFVADLTQLPLMTFQNGFSSDSGIDTWRAIGDPVVGTIDAGGNVYLPGVLAINCTQGVCPSPPCPCVPENLCSNDADRVCLPGANLPDLVCQDGGVCQGVCSDNRTKSCAGDVDCAPTGFCGQGTAMRFLADLTTGVGSFGDESRVGVPLDFGTGEFTVVDVIQTTPETVIIGDTGINSFAMTCVLDPIPSPLELPPPPVWSVKKGKVKLGKEGPMAADDKLVLKGTFSPLGGVADFDAEDLVVSFSEGDDGIVSFRVPAGSMTANGKGTKFKLKDKTGSVVVETPPLPPGAAPKHVVSIKRKKDGSHLLKLSSKGVALDGLNVSQLTSRIVFGTQSPSTVSAVQANGKGNKLKF